MKKGGYQILDLKNHNFTSGSSYSYPGCYDLISGTKKAILVSGLNIAGTEFNDFYGLFIVSSGNLVYKDTIQVTGKTLTITVKSDDTITVGYAA